MAAWIFHDTVADSRPYSPAQRPDRRQHSDAQPGRQSQVQQQRGDPIAAAARCPRPARPATRRHPRRPRAPTARRATAGPEQVDPRGTHRGHTATANSPSYPTPANAKNPYTARDSKVTNAGQRRPIRLCKARKVGPDGSSGCCSDKGCNFDVAPGTVSMYIASKARPRPVNL
jgi:hypothetical protein